MAKKKGTATETQQKKDVKKAESKKISQQENGNDIVTVALCHPLGIKFRLGKEHSVILRGNATDLIGKEKGILPMGGFGLTQIRRDEWEEIKRVYGKMAIFRNGLIFAHEKKSYVEEESHEKEDLRHGFEPIEVEGPNKTSKTEPAGN